MRGRERKNGFREQRDMGVGREGERAVVKKKEQSQMKGNGPLERGFGHGRQTLTAMRKTNQLGIVFLSVNAPQLRMIGYAPPIDETETERLPTQDWPEDYLQDLVPARRGGYLQNLNKRFPARSSSHIFLEPWGLLPPLSSNSSTAGGKPSPLATAIPNNKTTGG